MIENNTPAPPRETTQERCQAMSVDGGDKQQCKLLVDHDGPHLADRKFNALTFEIGWRRTDEEWRDLRTALAAETEARRKAEAERDSERDKAAANYASCERLRAERDTARADLEQEREARRKAEAERDDTRAALAVERTSPGAGRWNAERALRERAEAERDAARAELEAARRERDQWRAIADSRQADAIKEATYLEGVIDRIGAVFGVGPGDHEETIEAASTATERVRDLEAALKPFANAYYEERHNPNRVLKAVNGFAPSVVETARRALAAPPPSLSDGGTVQAPANSAQTPPSPFAAPGVFAKTPDSCADCGEVSCRCVSPSATREGEAKKCSLCEGTREVPSAGGDGAGVGGMMDCPECAAPPHRETATTGKDGGE